MKDTVIIDNKEYKISCKGATAFAFRQEFQKDLFLELDEAQRRVLNAAKEVNGKFNNDEFVMLVVKGVTPELLEKLAYACIKGQKELDEESFIPYEQFIMHIEDYDSFLGVCVAIYNYLTLNIKSTVKPIEGEEKSKKKQRRPS